MLRSREGLSDPVSRRDTKGKKKQLETSTGGSSQEPAWESYAADYSIEKLELINNVSEQQAAELAKSIPQEFFDRFFYRSQDRCNEHILTKRITNDLSRQEIKNNIDYLESFRNGFIDEKNQNIADVLKKVYFGLTTLLESKETKKKQKIIDACTEFNSYIVLKLSGICFADVLKKMGGCKIDEKKIELARIVKDIPPDAFDTCYYCDKFGRRVRHVLVVKMQKKDIKDTKMFNELDNLLQSLEYLESYNKGKYRPSEVGMNAEYEIAVFLVNAHMHMSECKDILPWQVQAFHEHLKPKLEELGFQHPQPSKRPLAARELIG